MNYRIIIYMVNQMKKYSALIIGAGNMGAMNDAPVTENSHKTISYANALIKNGNFVVHCHDLDFEKNKLACDTWNIDMLHPLECYDVIVIATPEDTHYEELVLAINRKPKLIICEKPFCTNHQEAEKIVALAEKMNVPILVDYTRRFIPHWQLHKKFLKSNGELKEYIVNINRGKLHTGSHLVDLFNWFFPDREFNHKFNYVDVPYRVFDFKLFFENGVIYESRITNDEPVSDIYDHHTKHVINNALGFLEGTETLLCTMYDGLRAHKVLKYVEWN